MSECSGCQLPVLGPFDICNDSMRCGRHRHGFSLCDKPRPHRPGKDADDTCRFGTRCKLHITRFSMQFSPSNGIDDAQAGHSHLQVIEPRSAAIEVDEIRPLPNSILYRHGQQASKTGDDTGGEYNSGCVPWRPDGCNENHGGHVPLGYAPTCYGQL